ncbi:hypothetical protein AB0N42_20455 [Streptomyces pseudogriseolus]|uniref:hypothetical protein n=1 Tax=Streptomyces pseudogriseolus TaxID=36817 RepID=UPI003474B5DD
MHYLIVDDRAEMRYARKGWLLETKDTPMDRTVDSVEALDFEDARALGEGWRKYDCLVVDAHDDRPIEHREARAIEANVPYRDYDRFPGREVVITARKHHPTLLIIATSYFARSVPEVAWGFAAAGVDILLGSDQVPERETFVAAVRNPHRPEEALQVARNKSSRVAEICELVAAATNDELDAIFDRNRKNRKRPSRPALDKMKQLKDLLGVVPQGGPKAPYAQHMRARLREFYLQHLPTMDPFRRNPD